MTCDEKTSPGQSHCVHLDQLMWMRLLVELQARRIVELERQKQTGPIGYFTVGSAATPPPEAE